ncbi:hypothetical protein SNEBB_001298 [Seison nebaliae]|nr:hypothetical protein SNEBB_001298 [Seison nebaliae]
MADKKDYESFLSGESDLKNLRKSRSKVKPNISHALKEQNDRNSTKTKRTPSIKRESKTKREKKPQTKNDRNRSSSKKLKTPQTIQIKSIFDTQIAPISNKISERITNESFKRTKSLPKVEKSEKHFKSETEEDEVTEEKFHEKLFPIENKIDNNFPIDWKSNEYTTRKKIIATKLSGTEFESRCAHTNLDQLVENNCFNIREPKKLNAQQIIENGLKNEEMVLMQLPSVLPYFYTEEKKTKLLEDDEIPDLTDAELQPFDKLQIEGNDDEQKNANVEVDELPEGRLGKIVVHKSGKAYFVTSKNVRFEITEGIPNSYLEEVYSVRSKDDDEKIFDHDEMEWREDGLSNNRLVNLGQIFDKLIVTPNLEEDCRE